MSGRLAAMGVPVRRGLNATLGLAATGLAFSCALARPVDVFERNPQIVERLTALAQWARTDIGDGNSDGRNQRPAGQVDRAHPLLLLRR
jgi:hypothetical protein